MYNKQFSKRHFTVMLAMVAALVLLAASALAIEPGAEVTITGGTLSGGDITFANLTNIVLDGTAKTATADWSIDNIIDARGTGAGWNATLQLSQFTEWEDDAYVVDGHTLATSSLLATTVPVVSKADDTSSDASAITVISQHTPLDTSSPVKLLFIDVGDGMGSFAISDMTVTLYVPANVRASTYKTDAVVALVSGP